MKQLYLLLPAFIFLQNIYAQNVGIGTANPTQKLEVNGGIKLGSTDNPVAGTIRYNANKSDFEGYNGSSWVSLTGGKSGWGNQFNYSYENAASEILLNYYQPAGSRGRGLGMSMSSFGDHLLIAAPSDYPDHNDGTANAGTVRLHRRTEGIWQPYFVLKSPNPAQGEYFGQSTAIDGNYFAVGAPGNNTNRGRVYMFQLQPDGTPAAMPSLSPGDGVAGDRFGTSLGLSNSMVIIGAPEKKIGANEKQGRASIYALNAATGVWEYNQHITAPDGKANNHFGAAVAIDGNTAVVAAEYYNGVDTGKVYIYRLSNGAWHHEATLKGKTKYDRFGASLSLEGDTLVVGARGIVGGNTDSGKVYVYVRTGNNWVQQALIKPDDSKDDDTFGASVSLYNGQIVVGAPWAYAGSYPYAGKAYIFKLNNGTWYQQAAFIPSVHQSDAQFGAQVLISGNSVVVSATGYNYASTDEHGRIFFYYR